MASGTDNRPRTVRVARLALQATRLDMEDRCRNDAREQWERVRRFRVCDLQRDNETETRQRERSLLAGMERIYRHASLSASRCASTTRCSMVMGTSGGIVASCGRRERAA